MECTLPAIRAIVVDMNAVTERGASGNTGELRRDSPSAGNLSLFGELL
jgi:hypothetical protein